VASEFPSWTNCKTRWWRSGSACKPKRPLTIRPGCGNWHVYSTNTELIIFCNQDINWFIFLVRPYVSDLSTFFVTNMRIISNLSYLNHLSISVKLFSGIKRHWCFGVAEKFLTTQFWFNLNIMYVLVWIILHETVACENQFKNNIPTELHWL